jgi:glutamine---fructose-6-phosphate transaminase (isomerizing)
MTYMEQEARAAPEAVQRFLDHNGNALAVLGKRLRELDPPLIITSARGSSDNAAGYLKYLSEILMGIPVASVGASVASVYGAELKLRNCLAVTISQSGQSPDIVTLQRAARRAGAVTLALVNVEDSPAGLNADVCMPMCAGKEMSVAATKSFIVSLAACAALVAHWAEDKALMEAVADLPEQLARAAAEDWSEVVVLAAKTKSLYVLGRGPSLPIAAETALKLKETCGIHAESYSVAEVMHGPLELVDKAFPVLVYAQADPSQDATLAAIEKLKAAGARVVAVDGGGLPVITAKHAMLQPILMIQSAYIAIEELARQRGRDPDAPRLLRKVTETF